MTPKLPEPGVLIRGYGPAYGTADGDGGAFTADQMLSFHDQGYREGLERAAQIAGEFHAWFKGLAAAIRKEIP
jgi:hypothetical protein